MLGTWKAATNTIERAVTSQKSFSVASDFLTTPILEPSLVHLNFHVFSTYIAFIFTLVATTKDVF